MRAALLVLLCAATGCTFRYTDSNAAQDAVPRTLASGSTGGDSTSTATTGSASGTSGASTSSTSTTGTSTTAATTGTSTTTTSVGTTGTTGTTSTTSTSATTSTTSTAGTTTGATTGAATVQLIIDTQSPSISAVIPFDAGSFLYADGDVHLLYDTGAKDDVLTSLPYATGLALLGDGGLYVSLDESTTNRIKLYSVSTWQEIPSGNIGTDSNGGTNDGSYGVATFDEPKGMTFDAQGHLIIADYYNSLIRSVDLGSHTVSTLAGNGFALYQNGPWLSASFNEPSAVALGPDGTIYVADSSNYRVRAITLDGGVSLVAGDGSQTVVPGPATQSGLGYLRGIAVDTDGTIYLADNAGFRVISNGTLSTVDLTQTGDLDSDLNALCLEAPRTLIVADANGHIARVTLP